jgi:imidazoleglycerol-phosphate dehydratase
MMMTQLNRTATIERITKETQIKLTLALDPSPSFENKLGTSLPFLNHMLNTLVCHGGLGIHVEAVGDIDVDPHHLIEDVGIVLGQAIVKALGGSFGGIQRAGCFSFPMDGTLASVALDVCGRGNLVWHVPAFESALVGAVDPRLFKEFFKGVVDGLALSLHVNVPYRDNDHHVVEAIFKAFARALRLALTPLEDGRMVSTKGTLEAPKV